MLEGEIKVQVGAEAELVKSATRTKARILAVLYTGAK